MPPRPRLLSMPTSEYGQEVWLVRSMYSRPPRSVGMGGYGIHWSNRARAEQYQAILRSRERRIQVFLASRRRHTCGVSEFSSWVQEISRCDVAGTRLADVGK